MDLKNSDTSIVEGQEWTEELKTYLHSLVDTYLVRWSKVVIELGVSDLYINEWVAIFKKQIEERFGDLLEDVNSMKSKVLDEITELLTKNQLYAEQLGIETDFQDINPNEKLYQVKRDLKERTERLDKMLEKRRKDIEKLMEKQKKLCNILEKTVVELSLSPLPHKDQIESVQNYVDSMEQEKFNREERYLALKEEIGQFAKELEYSPKTDFERNILSETKGNFDITESNMKLLQKFHDDILRLHEDRKQEIDQHKQKIDDLWNILEESMSKRHLFHEKYKGYSLSTLKVLRDEVKRLEDLKKANIRVFVEKLRAELQDLWRSCYHHSQENQANYQWLNSDLYTEDLLSYHELEVRKWRNFYTKNEKLINLFKEHEELWNHLLQMDSAGPNRYKNRGGQLLKEEKIRNKLSKKIPLLEEKIEEEALAYENFTGTPFMIFGTPIMDFIENLHKERDENRKNKLSARKQIQQDTLTPARSCMSLFPSSSKMCLTPKTPSVRRKLNKAATTTKRPKLEVTSSSKMQNGLRSVDPERLKKFRRLSQEKAKKIKKCRKLFTQNNKENFDDTNATNYDAFEKNISSRVDNCRSTLNPGDIQNSTEIIPGINVIPCTPSRLEGHTTPTKRNDRQGGLKLTRTPSSLKLIF